MFEIFKFVVVYDSTRGIKVKIGLLGRKNGNKIPSMKKLPDGI